MGTSQTIIVQLLAGLLNVKSVWSVLTTSGRNWIIFQTIMYTKGDYIFSGCSVPLLTLTVLFQPNTLKFSIKPRKFNNQIIFIQLKFKQLLMCYSEVGGAIYYTIPNLCKGHYIGFQTCENRCLQYISRGTYTSSAARQSWID